MPHAIRSDKTRGGFKLNCTTRDSVADTALLSACIRSIRVQSMSLTSSWWSHRFEAGCSSHHSDTIKGIQGTRRQRFYCNAQRSCSNQVLKNNFTRRCQPVDNFSSLRVTLLVLGIVVCIAVVILNSVDDEQVLFYSGRRLAAASSDSAIAKVHLDERYTFDGTHSDFAQQLYRRHLAGDEAAAITDTRDLKEVVNYVSDEFGLDFANLPAMLQQAVVWDMGYVAAADLGYVKVYTKCGMRMSELQISIQAYRSAGCEQQRCASPNGDIFYQSLYCNGYQMGNVSLCAAKNGITPVYGAMWSDGGTDDVVPVSEMQRHEWKENNISYTIMAIHLAGDPNIYRKCVMPSMIIPCVSYSEYSSGDWCSPEHGEVVPQWLELVKYGDVLRTDSSNWQKAALPVTISSLVLLLLVLGGAFVLWLKTQQKQHETEELLKQKRAVLGGRNSDGFSMMDDIDFILEAPGRSFIEDGAMPPSTLGWVPWQMPMKSKQLSKKSARGHSSEDLDAILWRGGSCNDVADANHIYLHDDSAHFDRSIRSPSKATTACLTSFHSCAAGSPRNTLASTFAKQTDSTEAASNSSASAGPASGAKINSLAQFQSDQAVISRRVPFMDVSLVRQLTTGAYGEVWVGRMRGDIVAVKRLIYDRPHKMRDLEDFASEVQLMASFSHANVLGLLGVAWTKLENMCLITQYMERGDLQRVLLHNNCKTQNSQSNDSLDEFSWASHKAKIARDVSCGLEYLHGLNPIVVHRDLKSKNVLIGDNYEAKIGDFGISCKRQDGETMTSGVGTAYWTAPEVLTGQKYSEKADVYSLGVVLAELDTGELPFYDARNSGGDKMEAIHILHLVVTGELQPTFTLDCPDDVRKLALACLNPIPDRRPTAKDVMNELTRLLESDNVVSNELTISQLGGFL